MFVGNPTTFSPSVVVNVLVILIAPKLASPLSPNTTVCVVASAQAVSWKVLELQTVSRAGLLHV